jgi:citrate lyase subunit gamma (acyl carrier protein)
VRKLAVAGTLESCDAMVTVEPSDKMEIKLESSVIEVFEENLLKCVKDTLNRLGVEEAKVFVQDRGAFDCTLSARIETAVQRASKAGDEL